MPLYRKKPLIIEAHKVENGCYDTMLEFFGEKPGDQYGYVMGTCHPFKEPVGGMISATNKNGFEMWIKTLEGDMWASYGDYIIKGVKGEFYPCKPDIFESTYEPVLESKNIF